MQKTNLYIHVPFCASRCSYCDFYTETQRSLQSQWLEALLLEIDERLAPLPPSTLGHIYLGGGTPSLLSPDELARIFERIARWQVIDPEAEVTIECNPDDVNARYAEALAQLPINRVSMGVQSFHEADLRFLGRRHTVQQVYEAVASLRRVGLDNLSLDLIYGLPKQTLELWRSNVERILSLDVPHISAYHLIYEEGTALTRLRDLGRVHEASEEESISFFQVLIDELTAAGYEHYEVSNFAKPGMYARLNTGYWQGIHYIGLGPSAHSFDGVGRSYNVADIQRYVSGMQTGVPQRELELLDEEERRHEYIMTRLRTMWGISRSEYRQLFGQRAEERLLERVQKYVQSAHVVVEEDCVRLSPSGYFLSDGIIVDLF